MVRGKGWRGKGKQGKTREYESIYDTSYYMYQTNYRKWGEGEREEARKEVSKESSKKEPQKNQFRYPGSETESFQTHEISKPHHLRTSFKYHNNQIKSHILENHLQFSSEQGKKQVSRSPPFLTREPENYLDALKYGGTLFDARETPRLSIEIEELSPKHKENM